jgi:hypothetical protein
MRSSRLSLRHFHLGQQRRRGTRSAIDHAFPRSSIAEPELGALPIIPSASMLSNICACPLYSFFIPLQVIL